MGNVLVPDTLEIGWETGLIGKRNGFHLSGLWYRIGARIEVVIPNVGVHNTLPA
jgi:hypothetical protein